MKENKLTLRQWFNKESVAGSICTLPFAVGFLCFTLVPICMSLYYSLTDYNILSQPKFIGLANYIEMFTADKRTLIIICYYFSYIYICPYEAGICLSSGCHPG